MRVMTDGGGGGGSYDSVVMRLDAVRAIASTLDRQAADLDRRRATISHLLDEAGEASTATGSLDAAARSARDLANDIRWRIDAALADPGTFEYEGKLFAVLRFGSRTEAIAAARADAVDLLRDIGGDFQFGAYNAHELAERYPEILEDVLVARVRATDPGYAAAFVEALGAPGVVRVLDVVAGVAQQPREVPGGEEVDRQLLGPFDEIVAIATRTHAPGVAQVEADLLRVEVSPQLWRLHLLLAAGGEPPDTAFTVAIARLVLDGPDHLRAYLHYTWPDPAVMQLHEVDTNVLNAVARDPEAAHQLLADEACRRMILHLDRAWEEPAGELAAAEGRVLQAALIDWPVGRADRADAAFATAQAVAHDVADAGVSDEVKRALADAAAPWLDRLAEAGPRDDVVGFVAELSHDHDALTRLLGHAAVTARATLARGIAQGRDDPGSLVRIGSEQQRIAQLYGLLAAGMVQADIDREERAALIAGSLKFVGGLATAGVIAATGVTGVGAAIAGATLGKAVDAGAAAVRNGLSGDGRDVEDFLGREVEAGLREAVAVDLYNDPDVRRRLGTDARDDGTAFPAVPGEWLDGDRIVPPAPDAGEETRERFARWFADWYGLETARPGTDPLRDRVELIIGPIRERVLGEMAEQKLFE